MDAVIIIPGWRDNPEIRCGIGDLRGVGISETYPDRAWVSVRIDRDFRWRAIPISEYDRIAILIRMNGGTMDHLDRPTLIWRNHP